MSPTRFAVAFSASALVVAACTATPDLTFVPDEGDGGATAVDGVGRVPDGASATPTGEDGATALPPGEDAAPVDASPFGGNDASAAPDVGTPPEDAASGVDAHGPAPTCPSGTPSGADVCCGSVPCVGKKCAQQCAACQACGGAFCCVPPNGKGATCAGSAAACPSPGN